LKATRSLYLTLGGENPVLSGYTDADWASLAHRHSISGFAFFYGHGAVSWSSKKQPIVTLSSTESEYVALTHASKEALWLRKLHSELHFFFDTLISDPTTLHCDNQGAITLSKESMFHMRTKHIDTRYHFIRYLISSNQISVPYCPTEDMIADIFTKALARTKFQHFRNLLGLSHLRSA
jgi:hypothetical protein